MVARSAGKFVAGDRSPNDIGYLADFARSRLFRSDIRVVHLVRDTRDVYLSTHRLKWIPEDKLRAEFPGDTPERYICVRYEDLITRPEQTLTPITDFLGVPFQSKMLDLYQGVRHHANVSREFLTSPMGAYRWELPPHIADDISTRADAAMRAFGLGSAEASELDTVLTGY